jgi:hypothetical protein
VAGGASRARDPARAWEYGYLVRGPQPDTSPDSPAVTAFRKKARGEPLTDAEEALLQSTTRKPKGPGIPHEKIESMLEERRRRERG